MITSNNNTSLKKIILIGISAILLVTLLCFVYVYGFKGNLFGWSAPQPKQSSTSTPSSTPNKTSSTPTTPTQTTPSDSTKTSSGSDQSQAPATQPDGSKVVNIAITSTNQTTSTYRIGVVIYSVQSGGTCTLTLSKQGYTTIVQTVGVQALPSSSACKGFDIPMSQLAAGDWQANVTFNNASYSGSTSQNIKVN